jgi:hypothetical protein
MNAILTDLLLQTLALPFAVAAVVAFGARAAGLTVAGLAVALGLIAGDLAGQAAVAGWPAVPPGGSVDKLVWLSAGGVVLGLAGERMTDPRQRRWLIAGGLALAVIWIGWARIAIPDTHAWLAALVTWGLVVWALGRVEAAGRGGGLVLALVLVAATAGIGLFASSYSMAQLIGVVAAALAGAMLAAGRGPEGFGRAARLAFAAPMAGLLTMLGLYTRAEPLALIMLALVPLTPGLAERIQATLAPDATGGTRTAVRLTTLGVVAGLPAAAAVAVAMSRAGPLYY